MLFNGTIVTLAGGARSQKAIAVKDGVVHTVGDPSDVRRLIGPSSEVINLRGRTVIPGINDSHFHPMRYGTNQPPLTLALGKEHVSSIAEIRELVKGAVADSKPGEWIRGYGWDQGYLKEGRAPTKGDVDDVSPHNPVILREWSGHAASVNSAALELAGIDKGSTAPGSGEIHRQGDGEPTGFLTESAVHLVEEVVPDFTEKELDTGLTQAVSSMHAHGITAVTDGGTGMATAKRYRRLMNEGRIRQRVNVMLESKGDIEDLEQLLTRGLDLESDPKWLSVKQCKVRADGVPTEAKTAWMSEEYIGGGTGDLLFDGEDAKEQITALRRRIITAHDLGYQVGTHACGDRAVDAVVEAYAEATANNPGKAARHYVIHGDFASSSTLETLSSEGFGINFNPGIKRSLSHQIEQIVGRERADYQWPYKTALSKGASVASSSDAPNVVPDFREGLAGMITRKSLATEEVFGTDERIDLDEALRTYTVAGAWQDGAEKWKGTLAEGMAADLVVMEGDILNASTKELVDTSVSMTVVGGEIVYDASAVSNSHGTASPAALTTSGLNTYMTVGCCSTSTGQHGVHA